MSCVDTVSKFRPELVLKRLTANKARKPFLKVKFRGQKQPIILQRVKVMQYIT